MNPKVFVMLRKKMNLPVDEASIFLVIAEARDVYKHENRF